MFKPIKENRSHTHWLEGLINPLTKADRVDYIATIVMHIFKFLSIE